MSETKGKNINYIYIDSKELTDEELSQIKISTSHMAYYKLNFWLNFNFIEFKNLIYYKVLANFLENDHPENFDEFSSVVVNNCKELWSNFEKILNSLVNQKSLREMANNFLIDNKIMTFDELQEYKISL
ncbi:hypothetical protein P344_02815 [Spiroplasma mirum ATCC 29335]|uniref:Uncharacterized protein n=1 Tax=Spiroplasma mirum ATCC 29335 TaxID=838561 RepID=W0GPA1_9MOLU|nr:MULTISPECIES: hypothetical protein [Spiroplasma]AHF60903.1 hypothetical protein SMM_0470 [Spiroplasma mirum ATCC 29335]AHI57908.1 hypothetical protein P344_02815 [Spiroplasma mirum ATCC 29335]AKM53017.1 hypothetical protein SATRI_v1c05290 [Spiroplasma atrichopogonis]